MRKIILVTSMASILIAGPAAADNDASKEEVVGLGAGAVIGAIAGGPVGLIVGAAIGAKIGDEFDVRNDQVDNLSASLGGSRQEVVSLERDIDSLTGDIDEMGSQLQRLQVVARPELLDLMQAGIEMDLLFRTDESVLADTTGSRLQSLAATLAGMPDVNVQLDGFADERGDPLYNQDLSAKRVAYVKQLLIDNGIVASRIKSAAHGESPAVDTNIDSYAFERKVSLTLYVDDAPSFASQ